MAAGRRPRRALWRRDGRHYYRQEVKRGSRGWRYGGMLCGRVPEPMTAHKDTYWRPHQHRSSKWPLSNCLISPHFVQKTFSLSRQFITIESQYYLISALNSNIKRSMVTIVCFFQSVDFVHKSTPKLPIHANNQFHLKGHLQIILLVSFFCMCSSQDHART